MGSNNLVYFTTLVSGTSDTSATRTTRAQHECNNSATRTTRVRHECYTNDTSATRVKHFGFHNNTSEDIFSHPDISYMANEKQNFILRTTFWKCIVSMPKCV